MAEATLQRMLITQVTKTDETHADLMAKGHRFRDIICFDLKDLEDGGVDVDALVVGQPKPVRFWAHYTVSDKMNSAGNPYLDLTYIQPLQDPAPASSADPGEMLAVLRDIHQAILNLTSAILSGNEPVVVSLPLPPSESEAAEYVAKLVEKQEVLAAQERGPAAAPAPVDPVRTIAPAPVEEKAYSDGQARKLVSTKMSAAVKAGTLLPTKANEIGKLGRVENWGKALDMLNEALEA